VVRVKSGQFFPADLVLLHSTEYKGICFIETKSLDGETNLKSKNAPLMLTESGLSNDTLISLCNYVVTC